MYANISCRFYISIWVHAKQHMFMSKPWGCWLYSFGRARLDASFNVLQLLTLNVPEH